MEADRMRLPRARTRVPIALCASMLVAGMVTGLALGRGNSVTLRPASAASPSVTSPYAVAVSSPARRAHAKQATIGGPRFAQAPPKKHKKGARPAPGQGVPSVALAAYEHAAGILAGSDPSCHITWEDIAGIGRVESDNGQTFGSAARVSATGTLTPPILGPALDGQNGFPAIPTTDGGVLEHDPLWTHAVGPMQFLPSTWLAYASDGNGDGVADPENFYDAALTTGVYLCTNGGDLSTPAGLNAAIYAYNHSSYYVGLVEQWIGYYTQAGVNALLAAGVGLLPTGTAAATGNPTGSTQPPPDASIALDDAVARTDATGAYTFTIEAFIGKTLGAKGQGVVAFSERSASVQLDIPGIGIVALRVLDGTGFVSLPSKLSTAVRAEGPWVEVTPTVLGRLPAPLAGGLGALTNDLTWLVTQLGGASRSVQLAGNGFVGGVPAVQYWGTTNIDRVAESLGPSAPQLASVASLLGNPNLNVDVWVDGRGMVRSAEISLPAVPGTSLGTPTIVQLFFANFGTSETVDLPPVSPVGSPNPSTTTSTTTTSTSTTTTTTSTSTSTTTSTTPPTSSSAPPATTPASAPPPSS